MIWTVLVVIFVLLVCSIKGFKRFRGPLFLQNVNLKSSKTVRTDMRRAENEGLGRKRIEMEELLNNFEDFHEECLGFVKEVTLLVRDLRRSMKAYGKLLDMLAEDNKNGNSEHLWPISRKSDAATLTSEGSSDPNIDNIDDIDRVD